MTFPIIIYLVFLGIFVAYSFFAIYHLDQFGYVGDSSRIVKILYIIFALTIVVVTIILLVRNMLSS